RRLLAEALGHAAEADPRHVGAVIGDEGAAGFALAYLRQRRGNGTRQVGARGYGDLQTLVGRGDDVDQFLVDEDGRPGEDHGGDFHLVRGQREHDVAGASGLSPMASASARRTSGEGSSRRMVSAASMTWRVSSAGRSSK